MKKAAITMVRNAPRILTTTLLTSFVLHRFSEALVPASFDASVRRDKAEEFQLKRVAHSQSTPSTAREAIDIQHAKSTRRRTLLVESSAAVLSAFILGDQAWAFEGSSISSQQQTVVITGANSGVGFEACKRLARRGHRLVLACRTLSKAQTAAVSLSEYGGTLIPAECDLASLSSIREFASRLPSLIDNSKVDCLCLNAGLCRNTAASTEIVRTTDGFELTVGTNHFGHFYLHHLLLPSMNRSGGRIVVTASGVHDPESPGGAQGETATLGDLLGLESQGKDCEMIDGGTFNADKAYKDSKLCNVLFTRELQSRLEADPDTKGIIVNCFSPGLIVGTGLFRDQNPLFTKLFDVVATDLVKVGETPSWGGGCLDYMTTVNTRGEYYNSDPGSSKYGDAAYGNQFAVFPVSREAQDDNKAKRLWMLTRSALGANGLEMHAVSKHCKAPRKRGKCEAEERKKAKRVQLADVAISKPYPYTYYPCPNDNYCIEPGTCTCYNVP